MISPICDKCKKELIQMGGILLSPPNSDGLVRKWHFCVSCYHTVAPYNQVTRFWRALVRIEAITEIYIYFVLCGWDSRMTLRLDVSEIPEDFLSTLSEGSRCYVETTLGAEEPQHLMFRNWNHG